MCHPLIFDARDVDKDIIYPEDVVGIPNIDLSKRLFMEKRKSMQVVYTLIKGGEMIWHIE